jgi:hypothetical protein
MSKPGPSKGEGGRPRKKAGTNEGRAGDGYKRRTVGPKSKGKQVYEHRAKAGLANVKGSKAKGTVVDHKDGNTGNNSPGNLRRTTKAGNARNR